eukprot:1160236-Pelagomonas_calceolata.AAC.5
MDIMLTGEDHSQADQPSSLAEVEFYLWMLSTIHPSVPPFIEVWNDVTVAWHSLCAAAKPCAAMPIGQLSQKHAAGQHGPLL